MSNPKITPKNLSYDSSLPPFLQRLHHSSASHSAYRDGRHERAVARPKRARDADADQEDEPVFVDEETGEVVTAEEFRALGAGAGAGANAGAEGQQVGPTGDAEAAVGSTGKDEKGKGEEKEKEKHTAKIGVSRKRKAAKVVGGDESAEEDTKVGQLRDVENKKGDAAMLGTREKKGTGKGKDKGKKMKLSFGDDEEG